MLAPLKVRNILVRTSREVSGWNHCTTEGFSFKTSHRGFWMTSYTDGPRFWLEPSERGPNGTSRAKKCFVVLVSSFISKNAQSILFHTHTHTHTFLRLPAELKCSQATGSLPSLNRQLWICITAAAFKVKRSMCSVSNLLQPVIHSKKEDKDGKKSMKHFQETAFMLAAGISCLCPTGLILYILFCDVCFPRPAR